MKPIASSSTLIRRKVSTLSESSFKSSTPAQPRVHRNPLGPSAKASCSTNTLGGRGGGIDEVKREYRDVASASSNA